MLLSAWLLVGPDGGVLAPPVERWERTLGLAPGALSAGLDGVWIAFHERSDLSRAIYLPARGSLRSPTPPAAAAALVAPPGGRWLVGLDLPRLLLRRSYYRDPDGWRHFAELPVDNAEYLAAALLERRLRGADGAVREALGERAATLLPDDPAERDERYLGALRDLGSHLVSVAHELRRGTARRRRAGRAACPPHPPPGSLFARWTRVFERPEDFRLGPPGSGAVGLEAEDRDFVLRDVLGVGWQGDAERDLPGLCAGTDP